jgi:adenylate cyclase
MSQTTARKSRVKVPFRTAITSVLLCVLLPTVLVLGISSYQAGRFTVEDLSAQILSQTTARMEERAEAMLRTGTAPCSLVLRYLQDEEREQGKPVDASRFGELGEYLHQVMQVYPQLSYLGLGHEARGDYCNGIRREDGTFAVQECVRNRAGKVERRDYEIAQGTRKLANFEKDSGYDPRIRPWYTTARKAGRQIWTPTYVFVNHPNPAVPGVSCAAPVYDRKGALVGVVSADFTLADLSAFLKTVRIGRSGFAFIVEVPEAGRQQVIAYPEVRRLLRQAGETWRLLTPQEMADPRVTAVLGEVAGRPRDGDGSFQPIRFTQGGIRYLAGYQPLSGDGAPRWLLCMVVPEAELMERVERQSRWTLGIGVAGVVLTFLIGLWISGWVTRPLAYLARDAQRIGMLELEARPPEETVVLEVDQLAGANEQMKTGLRSFRKFVPAEVVRKLLSSGEEARPSGERRTVTVYFSDISGFTAISERLDPEELVKLLGEYLDGLSAQIQEAGGTIDKYIGDGILAFWGAPEAMPDHARAACATAVRNQQRLRELHESRRAAGKPPFLTRIGLNTGEVIVGTIGSQARLNYTVLGDAVNLASRLEALNKHYGTEILISESTYTAAAGDIVARPLDWVSVVGRSQPVLVYEVLGLSGEIDDAVPERIQAYGAALARYREQDWAGAMALFQDALRVEPDDYAVRLMLARCRHYVENPPPPGWDGVHRMEQR